MRKEAGMKVRMLASVAAAMLFVGGAVQTVRAQNAGKAPEVTGSWSGVWGIYAPPPLPGEVPEKPRPNQQYPQMKLDCKVVEKDGKWQATFEGEAGGVYKYTVQMLGRQAGDVVLFQGTADLGEKGGGVYDWIGRATDREFVGFYTSSKYTGSFRLARPK
jgi:hypothetical protein